MVTVPAPVANALEFSTLTTLSFAEEYVTVLSVASFGETTTPMGILPKLVSIVPCVKLVGLFAVTCIFKSKSGSGYRRYLRVPGIIEHSEIYASASCCAVPACCIKIHRHGLEKGFYLTGV